MALPFDARTLRATGAAVPVAEKIEFGALRSIGVFSASATGVLAYRASPGPPPAQVSWLDRSGKAAGVPAIPPALVWNARLSPDGKTAALDIFDAQTGKNDLWLYDLVRGARSRLTPDGAGDPVFSPDGRRVAVAWRGSAASGLYITDSSGEGKPDLLLESPQDKAPLDWSSDGRWILFMQTVGQEGPGLGKPELWVWSVAERKAAPYLQNEWRARSAAFSPDGRWVAYESDESGHPEVSIRPFPGPGSRTQISKGGGGLPRWSRDGREIVYPCCGDKLMAVEVKTRSGFEATEPRVLLTLPTGTEVWDITSDHQRVFVAAPSTSVRNSAPLSIVTNWTAGLPR